jgi:HEAT repeat protein
MVDDYIKPAIAGITSRLNDAAAEALLDIAARTASSPVRIVCMDGVATIQQYQEARAAWERRASSRATRDSAVLRLVGMLRAEQAEVRREAVRGLRVLGAVERIPDLIERLGDEDEGVREAARAALDRLAEPPAAEAPATGAAEDADTSDAEELPDG